MRTAKKRNFSFGTTIINKKTQEAYDIKTAWGIERFYENLFFGDSHKEYEEVKTKIDGWLPVHPIMSNVYSVPVSDFLDIRSADTQEIERIRKGNDDENTLCESDA